MNRSRTVAAEAVTLLALLNSFSIRFDGELLAPFIEPLRRLSPLVKVEVSDSRLKLRVPVDARRSVELALPAEKEECPKLNPPLKARAGAFGVFDETVKMLKKARGSEHVRVRLKASDGALVVEPPRDGRRHARGPGLAQGPGGIGPSGPEEGEKGGWLSGSLLGWRFRPSRAAASLWPALGPRFTSVGLPSTVGGPAR